MHAITTDAVVTYLYTYLNRIKNVIAKHTKGQRVNTRETEKKMLNIAIMARIQFFLS